MPLTNCGSARNEPVKPGCAGLPVACSTNHGKATNVSWLPTIDTAVATTRARAGIMS